jgi:hypothetical protein
MCKGGGSGATFGMEVFYFQQNRLEQLACIILSLHELNPHEMGVMTNDNDVVAETMR